jgi:hypothetical protein
LYSKYLGRHQNFITTYSALASNNYLPIYYKNGLVGNFIYTYTQAGVSIAYSFGMNNQIGSLLAYEFFEIRPGNSIRIINPSWDFTKFGHPTPGISLFFKRNTLNSFLYPTKGLDLSLYAKQTFLPDEFYKSGNLLQTNYEDINVEPKSYFKSGFNLDYYCPIRGKTIINPNVQIGLSSDGIILTDYFFIGGNKYNLRYSQVPFVGLGYNQYYINNFLKAGLSVQQAVFKYVHLVAQVNVISGYESMKGMITNYLITQPDRDYFGYGGGFLISTPLGPVSFLVGENNHDQKLNLYFNIGFNFSEL